MSSGPENALAAFIAANYPTQSAFCEAHGFPQSTLSLWATGKRCPDVANAFRLERATDGAVPAIYWANIASDDPEDDEPPGEGETRRAPAP